MRKILPILLLLILSLGSFGQTNIAVGSNGKKGAYQKFTNKLVVPFEYDELYAVTKKGYDHGSIGRKNNVWRFFNPYGILIKDSLNIESYIGKYYGNFCWVKVNNRVKKFNFDSLKTEELSTDSILFTKPWGLIIQDKDENNGYVDQSGKILIDFKYEENWNFSRDRQIKDTIIPLLFTDKKRTYSDFYFHDGKFIKRFSGNILYLSASYKTPYLRVSRKGKTRFDGRDALAILNVEKKKIEYLTGFDYWYINEARGTVEVDGKKLKKIAEGTLPDKTNVYILEDGSTIEAPPSKF